MKGFIIAKPNIDGLKARENDDYVTTKAPILKIALRGKDKISFAAADAGNSKSIAIPHNLGYKPLVQIFADRKPLTRMRLVSSTIQTVTGDLLHAISYVEDNTFTIRFTAFDVVGDPTGQYRYFWYVFFDESEGN